MGRSPPALQSLSPSRIPAPLNGHACRMSPTWVGARYVRLRWRNGAGEDDGAQRIDRYRQHHHHLVVGLSWENEADCVVVCFVGLEVNSTVHLID
jgi:hypothetical protein